MVSYEDLAIAIFFSGFFGFFFGAMYCFCDILKKRKRNLLDAGLAYYELSKISGRVHLITVKSTTLEEAESLIRIYENIW